MSYAGEVSLIFEGPAHLCSSYLPHARVLLQQAREMYGVSDSNKLHITHTKTYDDGTTISIISPANAIPEITISVSDTVIEESTDLEQIETIKPFIAAYGILGPAAVSTDSEVGSPLPEELPAYYPTPLPDNYRLFAPPTFQVLPDGPDRVWGAAFEGTKNKLVELLIGQPTGISEGLSGAQLISEGIISRGAWMDQTVWRVVLEYPGMGEGYSRVRRKIPPITYDPLEGYTGIPQEAYDPVFGPNGDSSVDKVLAEGRLVQANSGVGAGGARYRFEGLPADLNGLLASSGVTGYSSEGWSLVETFTGSGPLPLPEYADVSVAGNKFDRYTPYGEWVLSATNNSVPELAGKVLPDGTLEGFPTEILLLDTLTTLNLHIRGAWGRVRIDVGVTTVSGGVIWPVPFIKRPVDYSVVAVPKEEIVLTFVVDPADVKYWESGTVEAVNTVAYKTSATSSPSPSVTCTVWRMTEPNHGSKSRPEYLGAMARQVAHPLVDTELPLAVYTAELEEITNTISYSTNPAIRSASFTSRFTYGRNLSFSPDVSSGGKAGTTLQFGSCPEHGFFVSASVATEGSTAALATLNLELDGLELEVKRDLSDNYYANYSYSDSGVPVIYNGYPGGTYFFTALATSYNYLLTANTSRSFSGGSNYYTERLTINGIEIDLVAIASQTVRYNIATFMGNSRELMTDASGFRDFVIKAVRVTKLGSAVRVTVVSGSAAYSIVYTSDGWVREKTSEAEIRAIDEVYKANQRFVTYPESTYATAFDADAGSVT